MAAQQSVVPAIGRSAARSRPWCWRDGLLPTRLSSALESLLGLVSEPVLKPETAPDAHLNSREISILLGDVLDLLEEEQTILQAADELYEAAFAFQDAREKRSTCVNITTRIVATRTRRSMPLWPGFGQASGRRGRMREHECGN